MAPPASTQEINAQCPATIQFFRPWPELLLAFTDSRLAECYESRLVIKNAKRKKIPADTINERSEIYYLLILTRSYLPIIRNCHGAQIHCWSQLDIFFLLIFLMTRCNLPIFMPLTNYRYSTKARKKQKKKHDNCQFRSVAINIVTALKYY